MSLSINISVNYPLAQWEPSGDGAPPAQRAAKPLLGLTKPFRTAPKFSSRAPVGNCPTAALGIWQTLTLSLAAATRRAAGRQGFPFTSPERVFNALGSSILHNRAEMGAKDRDTLLLRAPPGHNHSCQEASGQEGVEARGHLAMCPFVWGAQPWQASPRVCSTPRCTAMYLVPEKSLSQARKTPNSASQ